MDPAHSHDLVEVSVPFIPRLLSASFFTSRQRRRIQISAIRRQHQAHLTSLHRLLPLPQSTPAARHPPYEVGSELGARGTRPRRRGEAPTASRGLLQGAAGCRGRLRTWRSRLRPPLSQEDTSTRPRRGELPRRSVTVLVGGHRSVKFDLCVHSNV